MTNSNNKSFTILEVILAIFILTVAVFASFSLIQQTVVGVSLNQSKLIAYYLGQEGIENIRNIRDTNWLNDRAWDQGISSKVETIDKFTRETIISQLETNVLEVKIIIEWSERGREHSVEVINHLYNWL
jgi:Tfp pilus assembly protein PilV